MKAVQAVRFGDASVLEVSEISPPTLGKQDVMVQVHASGINPIEWKIRSGGMGKVLGRELPVTFGWACSGVITEVGPDVSQFKAGDEVYAYPAFSRGGTHAEFVSIDEAEVALKPSTLSFEQAAAVPMTAQAAMAAWETAKVEAGERILVHGGSGAVGHWLIQLAKLMGSEVIATASEQALDTVVKLGADHAIDYRKERFENIVNNIDVVFDLVGGDTQTRSWSVLGPGGRLVSTVSPPDKTSAEPTSTQGHFVFTPANGATLSELTTLIDNQSLRPLEVGQEFALKEIVEAHQRGESGNGKGKMILLPQRS